MSYDSLERARRASPKSLWPLALAAIALWALARPALAQHSDLPGASEHAEVCGPFDHQHRALSRLLSRHVRDGMVDYASLSSSARPALRAYLDTLGAPCPARYAAMSRTQKLAFLINAYNAFTLWWVIEHLPLSSIRDGASPDAAFETPFVSLPSLQPAPLSLNKLENDYLRAQFAEPRIHFALVCAARSCPVLRSEAYAADKLEAQLEQAAHDFIGDPRKNRYDAGGNTLSLSKIFEWFRDDFGNDGHDLGRYVARYLPKAQAAALARTRPDIRFLPYDWSLNGK